MSACCAFIPDARRPTSYVISDGNDHYIGEATREKSRLGLWHSMRAGSDVDRRVDSIRVRVDQVLSRYAADDADGVVALLDPHGFVLYGRVASEIARDATALRQMMSDDFALWHTAQFGVPIDGNGRWTVAPDAVGQYRTNCWLVG